MRFNSSVDAVYRIGIDSNVTWIKLTSSADPSLNIGSWEKIEYGNTAEKKYKVTVDIEILQNAPNSFENPGSLDNSGTIKIVNEITQTKAMPISIWDGTLSEPEKSDGTYLIREASQLAWIAEKVNRSSLTAETTGAGSPDEFDVKIMTDIDLNDLLWTPIGIDADSNNKFMGTFDGNGHIIYNLKVQQGAGYHAAGLFGALNGDVKNLTIDGADIDSLSKKVNGQTDNGTAVVAGSIYTSGTIKNVHVKNAEVDGNCYVGGIAGYVYGSIEGCTVSDTILRCEADNLEVPQSYDNGDKVGGIAGYFPEDSSNYIRGCVVSDTTIMGYRDVGGIAGYAMDEVSGCVVGSGVTLVWDYKHDYKSQNYGSDFDKYDFKHIIGEGSNTYNKNNSGSALIVKPITDTSGLLTAVNDSIGKTTIYILGTDLEIPTNLGSKEIVFVGVNDSSVSLLNKKINASGSTITFVDLTCEFGTEKYCGLQHSAKVVYEDCRIIGKQFLYAPTVVFTDCVLENKSDYSIWTYGASDVTFTDCTFDTGGKALLVYNEEIDSSFVANVTLDGCTFNDNNTLDTSKAAVETGVANFIDPTDNSSAAVETDTSNRYNLTFTGCTVNGFAVSEEGISTDSTFWSNKNSMNHDHLNVVIDGTDVY